MRGVSDSSPDNARRAQALHNTAMGLVRDAVIATDELDRVESLNPAAEALTGWPQAEAIGVACSDVVRLARATDGRPLPGPTAAVLRDGRTVRLTEPTVISARDGSSRPVIGTASAVREDAGVVRGVVLVLQDRTQQEAAAEALVSSEQRFSTLFRSSPFGAALVRADTVQVVDVNDALLTLLGFDRDEVIGLDMRELRLFTDRDLGRQILTKLDSEGRMPPVECGLRRKTGELLDVIFSAETLVIGGQRYGLGMVVDITQRKRAEELFRSLFHGAPFEGVLYRIIRDDSGKVVDWEVVDINRRGAATMGKLPAEVIGKRSVGLFGAEVMEPYLQTCREVLDTGEPREFETHFAYDDRDYLSVVFTIGTELYAVVSVDVTERNKLKAERDQLVEAISQANDVVVMTDTSGRIQYVNPAFERVTGYTREEAIGRNAGFVKSGEHDRSFYKSMWETISRGEVWRGQFVNLKKDGSRYVESATISPVRDTTGATVSYLAVKRDITRELELESLVRQSHKMESVGRLAGGIAHEFNNMLSVILGRAQLALSRPDLPFSARSDLMEIAEAGRRASEITRQLLAFARKQPIAPRVIDLNDAIHGTLRMLRRLLREGIELSWNPGERLWPVLADPGLVDQVLMNLALNASDAIGGAGVITIETRNVALNGNAGSAPAGEYVLLSVGDTGRGMPAEVLDRAFEPFFTTKGAGHGTGLGLAIVLGVVEQNGGFIDVDSAPGKGTRFSIYLPRCTENQPQEAAVEPAPKVPEGARTILLVEDESMILRLAKTALEQTGYVVYAAAGPGEALNLFRDHPGEIRLVVTDVIMPEMNGWELARRLREDDASLKVLLMSGYPREVVTDGEVADDLPFLQKPFTVEALLREVEGALNGASR